MRRRRKSVDRSEAPPVPLVIEHTPQDDTPSPQDAPDVSSAGAMPDNVPPHVWATLQQAGSVAAERLLDLLQSAKWDRLKVTDQTRLIELAMTRAYGPPVKREMKVSLTGQLNDATAESLAAMSSQDLPEHRTHTPRDEPQATG